MMLATTQSGKAFKADYFRHFMRDAFNAAGLLEVTTHGLRYTSATILKELGLDWETIGDITGHKTAEMVRLYTEKRRRVARSIAMLDASELQNTTDESAKPVE
ncbi:tyrosine-type recombinase/integrase [Sneathiella litorea]|uniref:Tyrosine-type recombinase/integrase n=1 Tax=Sneathiella litorea TaxID=2606216 RepID=A0A6L8WA62_9PROT|nr:tyrosine-type recombinase/integrase [Sneathiella litorea]MZR32056.1 tyrosine-type recombinase/integrase [Sneathiella litorea]